MKDRYPNLFLMGAPKCGSTSLFRYLKEHPSIYVSEKKEPNYLIFNNLVEKKAKKRIIERAVKTKNKYIDIYKDAEDEKYLLDGTIFLYMFPEALKKMKKIAPDYRAIMILRNPVDRFISHYKMSLNLNDTHKNIEDFIKNPINGMGLNSLELGLYAYNLKKVFEILEKQRIKIVLLDDLKKNVDTVMKDIYNFLDISTDTPRTDTKVYLSSQGVVRNTVIRNIYVNNPIIKKLKGVLRNTSVYKLKGVINEKLYNQLVVSEETKKYLYNYYKKDIIGLEKLIDINLDCWRNYG